MLCSVNLFPRTFQDCVLPLETHGLTRFSTKNNGFKQRSLGVFFKNNFFEKPFCERIREFSDRFEQKKTKKFQKVIFLNILVNLH